MNRARALRAAQRSTERLVGPPVVFSQTSQSLRRPQRPKKRHWARGGMRRRFHPSRRRGRGEADQKKERKSRSETASLTPCWRRAPRSGKTLMVLRM